MTNTRTHQQTTLTHVEYKTKANKRQNNKFKQATTNNITKHNNKQIHPRRNATHRNNQQTKQAGIYTFKKTIRGKKQSHTNKRNQQQHQPTKRNPNTNKHTEDRNKKKKNADTNRRTNQQSTQTYVE